MTSPYLMHYDIFESQRCFTHKNARFSFYCFDCQMFICNKCFKNHKTHNIEIKNDLREKADVFSELPLRGNFNPLEMMTKLKQNLIDIETVIHGQISRLSDSIKLLSNENIPLTTQEKKTIFELDHKEYKTLREFVRIANELKNDSKFLQNSFENCELKSYKNLRWISEQVKVLDSTVFREGYEPEIVLDNVTETSYFLGEGTKNHSITFDLKSYYFLHSIKMAVDNFDCSVKNFQVLVKDESGAWKTIKNYIKKKYDENNFFEEFPIHCEGRIFRFNFLDNWGERGGPYILVKRICFLVGDLII